VRAIIGDAFGAGNAHAENENRKIRDYCGTLVRLHDAGTLEAASDGINFLANRTFKVNGSPASVEQYVRNKMTPLLAEMKIAAQDTAVASATRWLNADGGRKLMADAKDYGELLKVKAPVDEFVIDGMCAAAAVAKPVALGNDSCSSNFACDSCCKF